MAVEGVGLLIEATLQWIGIHLQGYQNAELRDLATGSKPKFPNKSPSAILLAAGASSRMGQPKALLPVAGLPMIVKVLQKYLAAPLNRVLVVVDPEAESLIDLLRQYPVQVVFNSRVDRGMFSSVQAGLRALGEGRDVLIGLVDQPGLTTATITRLITGRRLTPKGILIPTYRGRSGHPILIGRKHLAKILCMSPPLTLKHFVVSQPQEVLRIAVPDRGVTQDIDDWETYQQELNR